MTIRISVVQEIARWRKSLALKPGFITVLVDEAPLLLEENGELCSSGTKESVFAGRADKHLLLAHQPRRAASLKAFAPALPLSELCFVAAVEICFSCRLTSSHLNGLQP